jgi:hypothetical protein
MSAVDEDDLMSPGGIDNVLVRQDETVFVDEKT